MTEIKVLGMLSGTSYDGVDAAVAGFSVEGDELVLRPLGLHSADFPRVLRENIARALPPARTTLEDVCRLDTELGQFFGRVAADACAAVSPADLIVSHGQTVFHWVDGTTALGTLQLGAAAWIAEATGLPVLSDVRTRDIAAGGQGAPLVSTMDALLLPADGTRRGALNLGGIANITVRDADGTVVAYDLGPANALIDAAVTELTNGAETMDAGGARAARGTVSGPLLDHLLTEPYYRLPAPKSTGKEVFHAAYLREHAEPYGVGGDDLVATVTELTAELVAAACRTHQLAELVIAGGGVRNPALMARIRALAPSVRVGESGEHGLPAQAKEAYLFALLGWLSWHGLPGTVPSATGARTPSVLGSLTPGAGPLRLPEPLRELPRRLRIA
ncbi:Anhydro-N-acetylmuramic acid kinase [Streptomyces sp. RB5]|uniref:Anhydro-N-acetylmuramic acid kinase n=1 Tax=Streptomyces smaragdinus TaxID=2585196 RepID=A0A7K0CED9_9ACTN|nr:anhydro-N-acetylmuramic acid kinase [Streptomyces smaragdinus]MQY11835.1 Anhydro-N-acetylmuramic acid kinase [Streptomyces smaragdinus]